MRKFLSLAALLLCVSGLAQSVKVTNPKRCGMDPDRLSLVDGVIEVAQRTNFKRWPILDQYISVGLIHLGSWEAEVEYVFDFFEKRCAWFDAWLAKQ